MLGPHMEKISDPRAQREAATGWPCFQTMVSSTKSLNSPLDLAYPWDPQPRYPVWFWHAAYTATANPSREAAAKNSDYLSFLLNYVDTYGIEAIVLHTGSSVGWDADAVLYGIIDFFQEYYIFELIGSTKAKIAIEIGAHLSEFNENPQVLAEATHKSGLIGWCLDLAHSHAAGVPYKLLRGVIEKYPPLVCHCNFPGSGFGSGKDIHGWRSFPAISNTGQRTKMVEELAVKEYDETLKLLNSKNVPLIWEGSGLQGSNAEFELGVLLEILNTQGG